MLGLGGFFLSVFANTVGIFAADYFISGFDFHGDFKDLLFAAFLLTVTYTFLRPILKLFFGPFIVLTLGLFTLVINALILYILDFFTEPLTIQGTVSLLLSSLLISTIHFLVTFGGKTRFHHP